MSRAQLAAFSSYATICFFVKKKIHHQAHSAESCKTKQKTFHQKQRQKTLFINSLILFKNFCLMKKNNKMNLFAAKQ